MNTYLFPAPDDRAAVETAVSVYLTTNKWNTRTRMLKAIRAVLDRYNVSKLSLADCTVYRSKPPGYAHITGKRQISGRNCPGCGADIYEWPGRVRIVSISEGFRQDDVTYGCQACNLIFRKKEDA